MFGRYRSRNNIGTEAQRFDTFDTPYRCYGALIPAKSIRYCRLLLTCRVISRADGIFVGSKY